VTATTADAAVDCVLTPEVTEGPYHLDGVMSRRDITEGKKGVPLRLKLKVVDAKTCTPIKGADVELWHADASGEYSGFDGAGSGTTDTRYLRGHQLTDSSGVATFDTVFPGWYPGRSPHIHLKVHVGGQEVHTGQLFFTTALEKRVYATSRYKSRGQGWTRNSSDNIYKQAGGSSAIARVTKRGGKKGYSGSLTMGVSS
jgi:protocatechuate 3,4-dioxygenase beta subunit